MADKELLPDPSGARNLSLDDLFKLHTTVCTWTSNADTKTSYGLVFAAVLLGLLIKEVDAGHGLWGGVHSCCCHMCFVTWLLERLIFFLSFVACVSSIIMLCLAIFARPKNTSSGNSLFFFGDIAGMQEGEYVRQMTELSRTAAQADIARQIHICSQICTKKFRWYNYGMKCLLASFVSLCIYLIFFA